MASAAKWVFNNAVSIYHEINKNPGVWNDFRIDIKVKWKVSLRCCHSEESFENDFLCRLPRRHSRQRKLFVLHFGARSVGGFVVSERRRRPEKRVQVCSGGISSEQRNSIWRVKPREMMEIYVATEKNKNPWNVVSGCSDWGEEEDKRPSKKDRSRRT